MIGKDSSLSVYPITREGKMKKNEGGDIEVKEDEVKEDKVKEEEVKEENVEEKKNESENDIKVV